MSIPIPSKFVEQAVGKYTHEMSKKKEEPDSLPKKIITISRQTGTGGRKIAEILGRRMNCTVWGREILDVLAQQSCLHFQKKMYESLDERKQTWIDTIVEDLFGRIDKYEYQRLLPKAIYVISQNDAVILGRGAGLLIAGSFRVRVKASMDTRIKNMLTFEKMSEKAALDAITTSDKERAAYIKELAHNLGIKDYMHAFDLEINNDTFSVPEASEIIQQAFDIFYEKKCRKMASG
ncbi:MAG: cytidylate kinase-like family protein [Deltaproteobacteria bacterium]|nr:cytidylate kinase-like family protein [Deltaproteobacteria bacterium]